MKAPCVHFWRPEFTDEAHATQQVLFRSTARQKLLNGAQQLVDAVRVTLGPKSKSVLIQKKWGAPLVCNDG
jgi:chaperonin GroEL